MNAVCVFCGSSPGHSPLYRTETRRFGAELARRGIDLVWGGGRVGLMGDVADAVLDGGRRAIGVIPSFLVEREVGHPRASELLVVESMHER
ncbi:MAG TPA: LOG family protein, partial [Polyangiaceae bacterium]|nr:LOG family protein [Polyangiaceae bacterium]